MSRRRLAFTPPPGLALAYHVCREAWYAPFQPSNDRTVLSVGLYNAANRGGCRWEFSIDEEQANGPTLQVKVFSDAWQAFMDIPEVFAALGDLGQGALVEEVVEILDEFGFRDFTRRENPNPGRFLDSTYTSG